MGDSMSKIQVDTIEGKTTAGSVAMPAGGHIIQTQYAVDLQTNTDVTTASSSAFVDLSGMTVDITPKYSTSKILIMYSYHIHINGGSTGWITTDTKLMRDSTNLIGENPVYGSGHREQHAGNYDQLIYVSKQYIDSPSSTSELTYKVQGKVTQNTVSMSYNADANGTGGSMVVMEIAQ